MAPLSSVCSGPGGRTIVALRFIVTAAWILLGGGPSSHALGQVQELAGASRGSLATAPAEGPAADGATTDSAPPDSEPQRVIPLFQGEDRLIDAPWPVKRVSVANPDVADVEVVSPQQVHLFGISPGITNLVMWSEDQRTWRARVEVEADLSRLQSQLSTVFDKAQLQVSQVGDVVVIRGTLARAEQATQLRQFLAASKLNHLDLTSVAGSQQVQLKVRIAEVSRNALKTLGINAFYGGSDWFGGVQIGSSAGPFVPMNVGVPEGTIINRAGGELPFTVAEGGIGVTPTATLFAGFPSADLELFVQALAENQYLRLLAEPTLVSYSGEEATFLAGGEFPVPIAQLGEGGTTAISIEYREFGVKLHFRPTVLGEGQIRLQVTPEVSELSDVGAVEVLGTRVPSLLTRRVRTTLELNSGQSFALAGLINRVNNARTSRVPGLGDIPVLGALFRSVRYSTAETELIVLVTASLAEPQSVPMEELPYPGMTLRPPDAWELYALGQIQGRNPGNVAPAHAERLKDLGLNQLNGPGAWATYERPEPTTAHMEKRDGGTPEASGP